MTLDKISFLLGVSSAGFATLASICGVFAWYLQHRVTIDKDATLAALRAEAATVRAAATDRPADVAAQIAAAPSAAQTPEEADAANAHVTQLELAPIPHRATLPHGERRKPLQEHRTSEPRRLSPEQRNAIIAAMQEHSGAPLHIVIVGDPEAGVFAADLIDAFKAADLNLRFSAIGAAQAAQPGLSLSMKDSGSPANIALQDAFKRAGLPLQIGPPAGTDSIDSLVVGMRQP